MATNGYPSNRVTISAGTAFKAGFFGFFGAIMASLIVSIIFGILVAILAVVGLMNYNFS